MLYIICCLSELIVMAVNSLGFFFAVNSVMVVIKMTVIGRFCGQYMYNICSTTELVIVKVCLCNFIFH